MRLTPVDADVAAPLQPFNSAGGGLQPQPLSATPASSAGAPPSSAPAQNTATNFSAISDKYAALADLDSTFNTPATQSTTTVNWGGSDSTVGSTVGSGIGSNINWGGSGSAGTGSGDGGALSWGGQAGGGGGAVNWNSSGLGGGVGGSSSAGGSVFGGTASTGENLFFLKYNVVTFLVVVFCEVDLYK